MKTTILLSFLYFSIFNASAQSFRTIQKSFGTSGTADLRDIKITPDHGLIMCGFTDSSKGFQKSHAGYGEHDYWVIKTDLLGRKQWDITLGGSDNDEPFSITPAPGGNGYLVAGYSVSGISGNKTTAAYGGYDVWVIKLDNAGNIEWQKTFGGSGDDGVGLGVDTTLDGGYVLAATSLSSISGTKTSPIYGTYNTDVWLLKLDAAGNVLMDKDYGGTFYDYVGQVKHTSDGGFIIGANSSSGKSGSKTEPNRGTSTDDEGLRMDYWVIKTDAQGNQLWDKTLGTSNPYDNLYSIIEAANGGYIISGVVEVGISGDKTTPQIGGRDYWIVKLSADGKILWDKTVGGNSIEDAGFLEPTKDGGFVLGGSSLSGISGNKTEASRGDFDYWIVKLDQNGVVQWDKTIGSNKEDVCWALSVAGKNQYVISGVSTAGISSDRTVPLKGYEDFWVVLVDYKPGVGLLINDASSVNNQALNKIDKFSVFPNPAHDVLNIRSPAKTKITLTDQGGKIILIKTVSNADQIHILNLPAGVYYLKSVLAAPVKIVVNH